jgi:Tol biopolymer transport system component
MRRTLAALAATVAALALLGALGDASRATFGGRNGLIVFDSNSLGQPCSGGGLYVDNQRGSGRRLLAEGHGGRFSPNGRRILFDSCDGVTTDIEVMDLDGGNRRVVLDLGVSVDSAAFDPSGRRIVFVRDRVPTGQGQTDLWTVGIDGNDLRRLTSDRSGESAPEWAPNGRFIAFAEHGKLKTIRPNGSRERVVGDGREPSISPSSHLIAFERRGDIWLSRANGSHQHRLVRPGGDGGAFSPEIGSPSFSADGRWVLYTRLTYASYGPGVASFANLWKIRANGTRKQLLRRTLRPDEWGVDVQAR